MGNVSSQVTFKNSKGQVLILKVSEGKIKIFHQLCSRPPLAVPTAHFCISSSQLQCPEGGLRTFPLFAFPVAATEREIPNAESHTSPAMRGTGHSPAQTRLLCVGRMFITQLLLSKHLRQICFLLDLENGSGGAGEELPLAAPKHLCTQILLLLKSLLIHTEMKRKAEHHCLFVMERKLILEWEYSVGQPWCLWCLPAVSG